MRLSITTVLPAAEDMLKEIRLVLKLIHFNIPPTSLYSHGIIKDRTDVSTAVQTGSLKLHKHYFNLKAFLKGNFGSSALVWVSLWTHSIGLYGQVAPVSHWHVTEYPRACCIPTHLQISAEQFNVRLQIVTYEACIRLILCVSNRHCSVVLCASLISPTTAKGPRGIPVLGWPPALRERTGDVYRIHMVWSGEASFQYMAAHI
jgi:hypothetical protein